MAIPDRPSRNLACAREQLVRGEIRFEVCGDRLNDDLVHVVACLQRLQLGSTFIGRAAEVGCRKWLVRREVLPPQLRGAAAGLRAYPITGDIACRTCRV